MRAGDDFTSAVLDVVAAIPPGSVMTYGDVAAVLGSRAARSVGGILSRYGADVPWWRVIRANGLPPAAHEERALEHYREEDTPLHWSSDGTYRIDLRRARHRA
ncbi:MGMT family protein [Salinibacterium sp. SYSU T00001]|uniref:MGMT family protein n=1 Tax=Homoserinimonas sedimenticola TaxID=2986805 RepID=UPI002235A8C1|nr:MGMT family protein [Salinibacterium sedimenticola]MCW4386045.1 MGMT family protein [Salinibacterium sedimenticola]